MNKIIRNKFVHFVYSFKLTINVFSFIFSVVHIVYQIAMQTRKKKSSTSKHQQHYQNELFNIQFFIYLTEAAAAAFHLKQTHITIQHLVLLSPLTSFLLLLRERE